jgi:hypothetical protein
LNNEKTELLHLKFFRNPFVGIAKKSKSSIMKEGVHFDEAKPASNTSATSRIQVQSTSEIRTVLISNGDQPDVFLSSFGMQSKF